MANLRICRKPPPPLGASRRVGMSKNRKINYSNSETIGRSDWSGELAGAGTSIRLVACHSARCMILCSSFLHSRGGFFFICGHLRQVTSKCQSGNKNQLNVYQWCCAQSGFWGCSLRCPSSGAVLACQCCCNVDGKMKRGSFFTVPFSLKSWFIVL